MKKRMQITVSEDLKKQMDDAKDFYGGYSGLIEKAVAEFLARPVEPYDDDIKDILLWIESYWRQRRLRKVPEVRVPGHFRNNEKRRRIEGSSHRQQHRVRNFPSGLHSFPQFRRHTFFELHANGLCASTLLQS